LNRSYEDLFALTTVEPTFFQKGGVPRWGTFEPGRSTDVYAVEAATMEISCQGCDARFHVLMERRSHGEPKTLAERILDGSIHYGDPPNVGCCPSGPSMNSEPVRILGYWSRSDWQWKRDPSLEIEMRRFCDPMTETMRRSVEERLEHAETDADTRSLLAQTLAADDERRAERTLEEVPTSYSRYAEADPR
jgi:hypothetical protein